MLRPHSWQAWVHDRKTLQSFTTERCGTILQTLITSDTPILRTSPHYAPASGPSLSRLNLPAEVIGNRELNPRPRAKLRELDYQLRVHAGCNSEMKEKINTDFRLQSEQSSILRSFRPERLAFHLGSPASLEGVRGRLRGFASRP